MMADLQAQGAGVPTSETMDSDVNGFILRMRGVRFAEDRLTSALESMIIDDGPLTPPAGDEPAPSRLNTRKPKKRRCRHPSRRGFSQAAREAASAARRANALLRADAAAPEVFIVRHASTSTLFSWEIRRFGGVVLFKSDLGFPSLGLAWAAGEAMLAQAPPS